MRNLTAMFPETPKSGDQKGDLDETTPAAPSMGPPPPPAGDRPKTARGPNLRVRAPRSPPDAPKSKEAKRGFNSGEPDVMLVDGLDDAEKKVTDDEEHMSMGEMEVSDLEGDGDESDQNTVIHRPNPRPRPPDLVPHPPKFQPHPPPPINSVFKPQVRIGCIISFIRVDLNFAIFATLAKRENKFPRNVCDFL